MATIILAGTPNRASPVQRMNVFDRITSAPWINETHVLRSFPGSTKLLQSSRHEHHARRALEAEPTLISRNEFVVLQVCAEPVFGNLAKDFAGVCYQ